MADTPEIRIMATPERPGGVACANIVSVCMLVRKYSEKVPRIKEHHIIIVTLLIEVALNIDSMGN